VSRGHEIAGSTAAGDALRDWQATRGDATIQYGPLPPYKPPPPPEVPGWLKTMGEWLESLFAPIGRFLGMSWPVFQYVLIALGILLALFLLWRLVIEPILDRRRNAAPAAEAEWTPDRSAALALLEDADRLAAEGKFGEAAHLLLQRSVHHIAVAKPDWLHPASTAREIALLPSLPQRARGAFAVIAERVERSRFALRALDAADWTAAREAYSDFALQKIAAA
jgi:hypothetical protein